MASGETLISASMLRPHLQRCGYRAPLLRSNYAVSDNLTIPLVGFAHHPADARSACIAAIDAAQVTAELVASLRLSAAPIVFACGPQGLEWWQQSVAQPKRMAVVPPSGVAEFFARHGDDFNPDAVYRAKTWGRFNDEHQLTFVDAGLMPLVENEIGERLQGLIVRCVQKLKAALRWEELSDKQSDWLLKSVFWLVSAKILRDKQVPGFQNLTLTQLDKTLRAVGRHYDAQPVEIPNPRRRVALQAIAADVEQFSNLQLATTEALAHVYENALVSKETRRSLGTHSTPSYLVDYIVGRLAPLIESIPIAQRNVFEPACGHSAFLVSAMRLLTELLPSERASPQKRLGYLRQRIHGCDIDVFALEIARLSLSLTDIPNPDGWDLKPCDMFEGDGLEAAAREATIFLANPPFENFTAKERASYERKGVRLRHTNKTAELLARVLPALPTGSVVGIVVPDGFLSSKNAAPVRRMLLNSFELQEICVFPDKVFTFADSESAVILGRKVDRVAETNSLKHRRVREWNFEAFRNDYATDNDSTVAQSNFGPAANYDLRWPDLSEVWDACASLPRFAEVALIGQGLTYKGPVGRPRNLPTIEEHFFAHAVKGFARMEPSLQIVQLPSDAWLSLAEPVVLRYRHGRPFGQPQVIFNEARSSRCPWRIKAMIDREGLATTGRFNVVRPKMEAGLSVEVLWAICNSPFANAYPYSHAGKRHNDAGLMRRMPVPKISNQDSERIEDAVRAFFDYVAPNAEGLCPPIESRRAAALLQAVDCEVLRLYALPPHLERRLLDFFAGFQREGVDFKFERYYPENFTDAISLVEFGAITMHWERTNRRREMLIRKKIEKSLSEVEKPELERLQSLATSRARLVAPLPLKELEAIHRRIVKGIF